MALVASGAISFSDINVELGRSSTTTISMSESVVYTLAGVSSGAAISMQTNFYGKSNGYTFNQTISTNTANYNLKSAATAAGWNGTIKLIATVTINSGIYVYSSSTSSYAFDTGATFPAGSTLALINNGVILGGGGPGGKGGDAAYQMGVTNAGSAGGVGGPAFIAQAAISVTNNGTIGGGGGGGGGGGSTKYG